MLNLEFEYHLKILLLFSLKFLWMIPELDLNELSITAHRSRKPVLIFTLWCPAYMLFLWRSNAIFLSPFEMIFWETCVSIESTFLAHHANSFPFWIRFCSRWSSGCRECWRFRANTAIDPISPREGIRELATAFQFNVWGKRGKVNEMFFFYDAYNTVI